MNWKSSLLTAAFLVAFTTSVQARDCFWGDRYVQCKNPFEGIKSIDVKLIKEGPNQRLRRHRHHTKYHKNHLRVVHRSKRHPKIHFDLPQLVAKTAEVVKELLDAPKNLFSRYELAHTSNASTTKLPIPLQQKLAEIQRSCINFRIISTGCWHGGHSLYVAHTHRVSLHCLNRAADFKVSNYSCAYAHLVKWPGGKSLDPSAVRHIHLSYAPRSHEWGHAFYHGGHGHRHHYARHHRVHVARG